MRERVSVGMFSYGVTDSEMYFGTRYDGLEETATDGDPGRLGALLGAEL